ncbi:hypothetical protein BGW38_010370 [Lunasporangiospora selenospora]|uniref:Uncharacterized protein n=1 Tax=Lunasporangiospora selenospora TaxID=979761 RepID=A0A9P6FYK4_9FUNG|nr:hypothetical protein BGW38_010370 [Lunasporangiospora selenospora]
MKNAEHITWAMKKCSAEHVSIAAFAIAFDYYDRQTAELNYRTLINNPELSQARRRRLLANLTTFNVNRANGFWAKRATIAQADVFAMKAAAVSMEVGLHQSKVICQKYLPPHGADTPDEDEAQHGTETEAESVEEDENGEEEAEAEAEEEEDGDEDENEDEVEDEDEDGNENEDEGTYFSYQEMSNLQANIAQAQHPECTWKSGDECIACQFQHYQKECLQALQDRLLKKSEIADVMAILGVFAPFLPSERMRECFGLSVLRDLAQSPELPEPNIDDSAVIRAVRLRINLKREEASETLRPLERTARMLFENLLETLPEQPDRSIAEFTFTANCVAPVLNGILNTAGETERLIRTEIRRLKARSPRHHS